MENKMTPLKQKYQSAYYCFNQPADGRIEHYMMFGGVRSLYSSKEEVIELCKKINAENGLPDVTL